jgi:hypothetical protein
MAKKESYANDPAKQLWREKIVEFIKDNYSSSELKNAKVLCLPGPEMLEVFEVYDQLGIKRKNIFGVEEDKLALAEINRLNDTLEKKIHVVPESVMDLINKTKPGIHFDIVSLDYKGYYNADKCWVIQQLAAKGLLGNRPIILTNYLSARENIKTQEHWAIMEEIRKNADELYALKDFAFVSSIQEKKDSIVVDKSATEFLREQRLQCMPATVLYEGTGFQNTRLFKEMYSAVPTLAAISRELLKEAETKPLGFMTKKLLAEGVQKLYLPDSISRVVVEYLFLRQTRFYTLNSHECYKYVSSTGSPMISDFYSFDKVDFKVKKDSSIGYDIKGGRVQGFATDYRNLNTFLAQFNNKLQELQSIRLSYEDAFPVERALLSIDSKRNHVARGKKKQSEREDPCAKPELEEICAHSTADLDGSGRPPKKVVADSYVNEVGGRSINHCGQDKEIPFKYDGIKILPNHRESVLYLLEQGKKATEIAAEFLSEDGKPRYLWQAIAAFGQKIGAYRSRRKTEPNRTGGEISSEHLGIIHEWILSGESPKTICYAFDNLYTPKQIKKHLNEGIAYEAKKPDCSA